MEFPVDALVSVNHGQLELSGHAYMDDLLHADPDHAHYFLLPNGRKVRISLSSVGFVPLYGANLEHKVLALFAPEDPLTAVALFLSAQWYAVENILRTVNPAREGLLQVRSVMERVVLYILNRIVYRTSEMVTGDVPFLCHDKNDYAKILWKGGHAVGFYSIKTRGSWNQIHHLPVMNSIFVRKGHRGNGHGLQMLEDFVDSFTEDELGLKYPLSPAMSQVCRHYLARYPADVDLLWEVEGVGGPYQRTQLASRLSTQAFTGGHYQDDLRNGMMARAKVDATEETALYSTEETAVNKHLGFAEEVDSRPISTRTRSSEHRWRKRAREELVQEAADSQPTKIARGAEPQLEPVDPVTAVISGEEHQEVSPPTGEMVEVSGTSEVPAVEQEAKELVPEEAGPVPEEAGPVPEEAEAEAESFQNGTSRELEAEEQVAVKEADGVQNSSVENQEEEVEPGPAENQEKDMDLATEEQQEEEVAENKQEEETPTSVGEQKGGVAPGSDECTGNMEEDGELCASPEGETAETATPEEEEDQKETRHEGEELREAKGKAVAVAEEVGGEAGGNASVELQDATAPDLHPLRRGRSKAMPKHASRNVGKAVAQEGEGLEDEEKGPSTEEEAEHSSEEAEQSWEEAGHSSEEEEQGEEPHVVDMRVLRRKTKVYQTTTPQHRAKQRGKM